MKLLTKLSKNTPDNIAGLTGTGELTLNSGKSSGILKRIPLLGFLFGLYKFYIIDSLLIVKNHGFKTLLQQRGKKLFLVVFSYYLIRDTFLYILLPYAIAQGFFTS